MSVEARFVNAIERGDAGRIERLIAEASIDVNRRMHVRGFDRPLQPLLIAAQLGQKAAVDELLDAGAHVDCENENGQTPCWLAAAWGYNDVLATLIARGADLSHVDTNGRSVLAAAVVSERDRPVIMLIEAGAARHDCNGACWAAAMSLDVIQALVSNNVDIVALRDKSGASPCQFAVNRNCRAVLHRLIKVLGVDIHARDCNGLTCLHWFANDDHLEPLRWCIEVGGADIDVRDNEGSTPLHDAARWDRFEAVLLLVAANADVHARDKRGQTPLFVATRLAHPLTALCCLLVVAGADLDGGDQHGITPRELAGASVGFVAPSDDELESARRSLNVAQLAYVRQRAFQVCVGLQSRALDALCTCKVLQRACGAAGKSIPFHIWWTIATTVKHFRREGNE